MNLIQKNKKIVVMFSVFTVSFLLGYLGYAVLSTNSESLMIYSTPVNSYLQVSALQKDHYFVSSINSTKYHFITCSGAKRIKQENKIYFSSIEEAESGGYSPAKNCKEINLFR